MGVRRSFDETAQYLSTQSNPETAEQTKAEAGNDDILANVEAEVITDFL